MSEENDLDLQRKAAREVTRLIRANRWRNVQMTVLTVVVVAVCYLVFRNHELVSTFQSAGYHGCLSGNLARSTNVSVWDDFINLLLKGSHDARAIAEGRNFEKLVATHEKPQACAALWPSEPWWRFW